MIPQPNLEKRIESADTIVIARLISGITVAVGGQLSSDVVLRVVHRFKGNAVDGSIIPAHLEGRGYFAVGNTAQTAAEPLYGIWFLSSAPRPYTIMSRDENFGELHFAPVVLPEGAPVADALGAPAVSVANELASAMRWMAETFGAQMNPQAEHTGTPEERRRAELARSQFRTLTDDFRTLSASTVLPIYRQFATDNSASLRAVGIAGLIAANDPEGVKRAAADWSELTASTDFTPIVNNLMAYSNDRDPDAIKALGALALREPAEAGLRENAAYALRAIHSKETLPALVRLLDYKEERVRPYALSGLCLFVRNSPAITPEGVVSMSWLQSRQPTPFLNPETQRYCLLGAAPNGSADLDAYAAFWKSWWQEHRAELEE